MWKLLKSEKRRPEVLEPIQTTDGDFRNWHERGYLGNAPHSVKMSVLSHYSVPGSTWIETGTYRGQTTRFLATISPKVHTIEPSIELVNLARNAHLGDNVEIHHGLSEEVFPSLVEDLSGAVNFWLDGHWSSGDTFRGPLDTPIEIELDVISHNLERLSNVAVFVDDFRCFANWERRNIYDSYPRPEFLVNWAVENGLRWTVEQDIFVAVSR